MQLRRLFTVVALVCWFSSVSAVSAQDRIGLRNLASARSFLLGTAAPIDLLRNNADNGNFPTVAAAEFNMIEPENDFKPPALWLGENNYNFDRTDWLLGAPGQIGWAQSNGIAVRGHVLVYARDDGYTIPNWLLQQEANIDYGRAKQLLHDYIFDVAGRYKGKIAMWDVLNEAIADVPNNRPFNLRDSFWYRKLGTDFIKFAFQWAHEADPTAELYYNDYNIETPGRKFDSALELIKWVRQQGVEVTGMGLQYHLRVVDTITPGDGHYQNVQRLRDENFQFMITELDVRMPVKAYAPSDPRFGLEPVNPADLDKQANIFRAALHMSLTMPNCHALNIWGFTDAHSWIPSTFAGAGAATIFTAAYEPKPAYWQMQEELGRNLPDGVYRLSAQSDPHLFLGIADLTKNSGRVAFYAGTSAAGKARDAANRYNRQLWQLTWQNDGTYRISPVVAPQQALFPFGKTWAPGRVQTQLWSGSNNQEWIVTPHDDGTFRIAMRPAWWLVMNKSARQAAPRMTLPISTDSQAWNFEPQQAQ
ncbi:MAG TPA: endo-1,4-beta-xylanase [Abditibacteriaceae bacterium]|jgi:endo-1,4-beta-xylanase